MNPETRNLKPKFSEQEFPDFYPHDMAKDGPLV